MLYKVGREDISKKVTFEQRAKGIYEQLSGSRVDQAESRASEKALRQEDAWHTGETASLSVWLQQGV